MNPNQKPHPRTIESLQKPGRGGGAGGMVTCQCDTRIQKARSHHVPTFTLGVFNSEKITCV